jgi:sporulation protein YlmC with PRC-barrel domain
MERPQTAALHKLSDTDFTVADPAEDVRGRKVLDKVGEEIGSVDDLLIDDREKKVRFLRVAAGGFLGLGETTFLIPVDAVTRVTPDAVRVDQTRERVTAGPRYDPDVVREPDWSSVYGYYGYPPYWGPGYVYPPYPFYP